MSPAKALPLLAAAEEKAYRISEKPCAPGLAVPARPAASDGEVQALVSGGAGAVGGGGVAAGPAAVPGGGVEIREVFAVEQGRDGVEIGADKGCGIITQRRNFGYATVVRLEFGKAAQVEHVFTVVLFGVIRPARP